MVKNKTSKSGNLGRKLGAFTLSSIPLNMLTTKLSPTANVLVSTRFLKLQGIDGGTSGNASELLSSVTPVAPMVAETSSTATVTT